MVEFLEKMKKNHERLMEINEKIIEKGEKDEWIEVIIKRQTEIIAFLRRRIELERKIEREDKSLLNAVYDFPLILGDQELGKIQRRYFMPGNDPVSNSNEATTETITEPIAPIQNKVLTEQVTAIIDNSDDDTDSSGYVPMTEIVTTINNISDDDTNSSQTSDSEPDFVEVSTRKRLRLNRLRLWFKGSNNEFLRIDRKMKHGKLHYKIKGPKISVESVDKICVLEIRKFLKLYGITECYCSRSDLCFKMNREIDRLGVDGLITSKHGGNQFLKYVVSKI